MYTRASYHIPSCFLSISAILESAARQFYLLSQERYTRYRIARAGTYARIVPLSIFAVKETRVAQNVEIKQPPDKRWACACYAHLVTCSGKLGAARLVPLSPPFPSSPLSLPLPRALFLCGSYPRHVRRSHRKREQCRGIAILCKQPRAVSALTCFPSLYFVPPSSRSLVVSTLHSASAPALVLALRRVAQCTRLVLYPTCISMGLLVANTESAIPSDR